MCMRTLFLSDERGGVGGWLIEGDDYFKYFHQGGGGDYSREAINQGTAIIQGNEVHVKCTWITLSSVYFIIHIRS